MFFYISRDACTHAHGYGLSCTSVLQLKCRDHQTSSRCAMSEKGRGGGQCLPLQSGDKSCSRICREKYLTLHSVTFILNTENNPTLIWFHWKIKHNQISNPWNYSNLNGCFSQPDLRISLSWKFQRSLGQPNEWWIFLKQTAESRPSGGPLYTLRRL